LEKKTLYQLKSLEGLVFNFIEELGDTPDTLSELKAFARPRKENFTSHDPFGRLLQYIRLSHEHFVIRSFGSDGAQNTLDSVRDPSVGHWNEIPESTLVYRYKSEVSLNMYAPTLALGINSPDGQWFAQIYFDRMSGKKQLLVRHRTEQSFFMIANHDLVEEFLWLPDSSQILFTATSSARYPDGVYIWNLLTDQTVNLLANNQMNLMLGEDFHVDSMYLSLSGISADGNKAYVYIEPRHSNELSPRQFFRFSKLYAISLDGSLFNPEITSLGYLENEPDVDKNPRLMQKDLEGAFNDSVYYAWVNLPLSGTIDNVIAQWQNFAERYSESLLFSYCLWYLSVIYSDAYRVLVSKGNMERDAEIIRSYGAEL
jgi:hypothetical protein